MLLEITEDNIIDVGVETLVAADVILDDCMVKVDPIVDNEEAVVCGTDDEVPEGDDCKTTDIIELGSNDVVEVVKELLDGTVPVVEDNSIDVVVITVGELDGKIRLELVVVTDEDTAVEAPLTDDAAGGDEVEPELDEDG